MKAIPTANFNVAEHNLSLLLREYIEELFGEKLQKVMQDGCYVPFYCEKTRYNLFGRFIQVKSTGRNSACISYVIYDESQRFFDRLFNRKRYSLVISFLINLDAEWPVQPVRYMEKRNPGRQHIKLTPEFVELTGKIPQYKLNDFEKLGGNVSSSERRHYIVREAVRCLEREKYSEHCSQQWRNPKIMQRLP